MTFTIAFVFFMNVLCSCSGLFVVTCLFYHIRGTRNYLTMRSLTTNEPKGPHKVLVGVAATRTFYNYYIIAIPRGVFTIKVSQIGVN